MFGSTVLDVAIGMCLIYLLFSLICSAISELIEGFAKNRAADLERGIRELLSHQAGDQAVQKFYDHPLIYSLFAGDFQSAALKKWWQKGRSLPSYIPARNFRLSYDGSRVARVGNTGFRCRWFYAGTGDTRPEWSGSLTTPLLRARLRLNQQ